MSAPKVGPQMSKGCAMSSRMDSPRNAKQSPIISCQWWPRNCCDILWGLSFLVADCFFGSILIFLLHKCDSVAPVLERLICFLLTFSSSSFPGSMDDCYVSRGQVQVVFFCGFTDFSDEIMWNWDKEMLWATMVDTHFELHIDQYLFSAWHEKNNKKQTYIIAFFMMYGLLIILCDFKFEFSLV